MLDGSPSEKLSICQLVLFCSQSNPMILFRRTGGKLTGLIFQVKRLQLTDEFSARKIFSIAAAAMHSLIQRGGWHGDNLSIKYGRNSLSVNSSFKSFNSCRGTNFAPHFLFDIRLSLADLSIWYLIAASSSSRSISAFICSLSLLIFW